MSSTEVTALPDWVASNQSLFYLTTNVFLYKQAHSMAWRTGDKELPCSQNKDYTIGTAV